MVSQTYQQVQQIRGFYGFADPLDVDRYTINGAERDAVVAVREIDYTGLPAGSRTSPTCTRPTRTASASSAAYGNTATVDGKPNFFSFDVPNQGELDVDAAADLLRGEHRPQYSIVGGPAGSTPQELDFPDDTSATGQANNTYTGTRWRPGRLAVQPAACSPCGSRRATSCSRTW